MEKIESSTQWMGELIDDILRLSRVSRSEMNLESVDLSALAKSILSKFQVRDPDRKVEIDVAEDLVACGDRGLVEILLENLLANAWKFTAKVSRPAISVGSRMVDGEPLFFVKDNGIGFDQAYAGKLFKPFERLHGAEFAGSGIGLAIALRIVQRHRGRIWAESAPDKGATFFFTLPPTKQAEL